MEKIILYKLHSLGVYGSQAISVHNLRIGIKDHTIQEFEDCIITLFKKGLIIISNSSGKPGISLNPLKNEEIKTLVR